jgi:two-component system, OmpR family, sensor kinase
LTRPLAPWRQLHVRAALVAIPLLVLLGATMFAMLRHYSAQTGLESTQRMNLGLARYVVEHQEPGLISPTGEPDRARMKALALHVMMINPAVEVYLLGADGRVLAHALEGLQGTDPVGRWVDLAPVQSLLSTAPEALRLPVFGTDPRHGGAMNVVSVAPLSTPAGMAGYLYIVLNGQTLQSVNASLANSGALRAVAIGLALATLLAGVVLLLALRKLTRPLRDLTTELQAFRGVADGAPEAAAGDEIGVLRAAVRAMQDRIAQQFKRLEEADHHRRELVSNISHDLRTPLSSIQGYVETVLLRAELLDAPTRAQHLRTALRHADLLGRRIGDLFELSKLDAGRMAPKVEVFCLAELLQDVVQNYLLAAQQRGIRLSLSAGSQMQARVLADIALIERVLQNLIDNALRHTAAGGEVTLTLQARGTQLEIGVADTGQGIAQEHLPHIFDRYWHGGEPGTASSAGSGSGLGLAIVKRILDVHGCAVRVHSELRRGTRFEFALPRVAEVG